MKMRVVFAALVSLCVACQGAEMTGSSQTRKGSAPLGAKGGSQPGAPGEPKTKPKTGKKAPLDPGKEKAAKPGEKTVGTKAKPAEPEAAKPALGEVVDQADDASSSVGDEGAKSGTTDLGGLDILAGLLAGAQVLVDSGIVAQEGDNVVVFGGEKAFHIGDDAFDDSTCIDQLEVIPQTGSSYAFEIKTQKGATDIDAVVEICGVDYRTNVLEVLQGAKVLERIAIEPSQKIVKIHVTLAAIAEYAFVLRSGSGKLDNAENPDDLDDYIAKKVSISASKPIKAGRVYTLGN